MTRFDMFRVNQISYISSYPAKIIDGMGNVSISSLASTIRTFVLVLMNFTKWTNLTPQQRVVTFQRLHTNLHKK